MGDTNAEAQFESLLDYLKGTRAFDFTGYKRASLMRRVSRRMQALGIEGFADFQDYLEVHPEEFSELFNTILINVTSFFRDAPAWNFLNDEILPRVIEASGDADPLRIWSAGCATGEETCTIAMCLAEKLGTAQFLERVKIFATDVDEHATVLARRASYSIKDLEAVPEPLRQKYFEPAPGDRWGFSKDLRRAMIFGRHDLMQDAPISRVDLLICRNTLMYFNTESQGRILDRFHFALRPGGYLFLGRAEMLVSRSKLFSVVDARHHVFMRAHAVQRDRLLMAANDGTGDGSLKSGQSRVYEAAFDIDPVAQFVVDPEGVLALANDRARALFGLSREDLGRPLQDLEVSYRPVELRSLIERAYIERQPVGLKDISWPHADGSDGRYMDVQVVPLHDSTGAPSGIKVIFADVSRYKRLQSDLEHARQELETAYEELQSSNEEKETANEELQSTNEELETTNEELHSTNEELETMNEELQSSNEELQTTNDELRDTSNQLKKANLFLSSVLSGISSAVITVDRNLLIETWNPRAEDLWGVRAGEVAGKNLLSIEMGLPVEQLMPQIRRCLSGEQSRIEMEVTATNRRGKTIPCRVIISPQTEPDSDIEGAILLVDETHGR